MKQENQGFTLIELIIAIAVLSVMAGVLFQPFLISRRMNAKSRKEEVVLDVARKTMERFKGYSFSELEQLSETEEAGVLNIGGITYEYEPLLDKPSAEKEEEETNGSDTEIKKEGYRLIREYKSKKTDDKAEYLICVEADRGRYGLEEDSGSYSINHYQMPNIADVSSFQNIVYDPLTLEKDDELLIEELLLKVNPEENEEEGEGENTKEDDGGSEDEEEKIIFDIEDISKYIFLNLEEQGTGREMTGADKLSSHLKLVYTVAFSDAAAGEKKEKPQKIEDIPKGLSLISELPAIKRTVIIDEKYGKPLNRLYLFLPESVEFESIFVTARLGHPYELYVIQPSLTAGEGMKKEDIILPREARKEGGSIQLYSNLEIKESVTQDQPVSLYEAENRLYHLTVTVYEADYSSGELESGAEILRLDSAKPE